MTFDLFGEEPLIGYACPLTLNPFPRGGEGENKHSVKLRPKHGKPVKFPFLQAVSCYSVSLEFVIKFVIGYL